MEEHCLVAVSKNSIKTDPASGSVIAGLEGSMNVTTITCKVFGHIQQRTVWHLQHVQENSDMQPLSDPAISNMFDVDRNDVYHNSKLTIVNLTSPLDGATVFCGTAEKPRQANFTIRITRK